MKPIRILLIDESDSPPAFLPLEGLQGGARVITEHAHSAPAVEQSLHWFKPDLVLSEFGLPGFNALHALELVRRLSPEIPFVFVSDSLSESQALNALRQGAFDHVPKGDRMRLLSVLRHALSKVFERRARIDAERALQESEMRFRLFMEHMPGAVYMKDLDGRFTFVNSVAKRIMGRPGEEILGKTLHQLYPSDVADAMSENDRRALSVRQPVEALERAETPEGQRIFLSVKFPVISVDGQPVMVGGFSIDVTQAKAAAPDR